VAQKPNQRQSPEAPEEKSEPVKYTDARKFLHNYGFLKDSVPCNVATMAKAIAEILRTNSQPIQAKTEKALALLAYVASKTETQ
jgi:uncharacterized protein (UPF0147 family)